MGLYKAIELLPAEVSALLDVDHRTDPMHDTEGIPVGPCNAPQEGMLVLQVGVMYDISQRFFRDAQFISEALLGLPFTTVLRAIRKQD